MPSIILLEDGGAALLEDGASRFDVEFDLSGAGASLGSLLSESGFRLLLEDGSSSFLLEAGAAGPAPIVGYFVDPDLASLVSPIATGLVPLISGEAQDLPVQTWLYNGMPAWYAADDLIVAYCYQARASFPLFQPAVAWNGPTGYTGGQVVISIPNVQSALLVPSIPYTLVVSWASSATPAKIAAIARLRLAVLQPAFP